jgi:hypothetical protein
MLFRCNNHKCDIRTVNSGITHIESVITGVKKECYNNKSSQNQTALPPPLREATSPPRPPLSPFPPSAPLLAPRRLVYFPIGVGEEGDETEHAAARSMVPRAFRGESEGGRGYAMRANGEHTAAVPIPVRPAAEDSEKEKRKNRRRSSRRLRQAEIAPAAAQGPTHADTAWPRPCRSMPPMHVGGGAQDEAEAATAGTSQSCPLLPTPSASDAPSRKTSSGRAAGRRYFQPHWPEQAVDEAIKVFSGLMGGLQLRGCHFGRTDTLFLCLCLTEGPCLRWEVPSECTQTKRGKHGLLRMLFTVILFVSDCSVTFESRVFVGVLHH